jgi:hypothetical protein
MMPWWYYRGRVTTPVEIPGKGSTIIRPRMRFQAPLPAVMHLKNIGLVVACEPPATVRTEPIIQAKEERPQLPEEAPASKSDTGGVEKALDRDALGLSAVVASEPSEPEARVEVVEREQAVEAEPEQKQEEKEEEEKKKPWRKRNR